MPIPAIRRSEIIAPALRLDRFAGIVYDGL